MTKTNRSDCVMKNKCIIVLFVVIVCLMLSSMSFAFAKTPIEYNIIASTKDNSIIDTKAQKKLYFSIIDDSEEVYYNNKKINIKDHEFYVDVSKLSGKQEIIFSDVNDNKVSFKYLFSDKKGKLQDYELVTGKNLNVFITTVKNIKIIYTDKEKSSVSKIKSYLNKAPKNMLVNLKEIKMIPYSNSSNIAGTTKDETITLYNFSKYTANTQKNIIYHEIAHTWAKYLMDKKVIDYSYTKYNEYVNKDNNFVSGYAKDFADGHNGRLSEDFADSLAFYIINQKSFKKQYPNRTEYLKALLSL